MTKRNNEGVERKPTRLDQVERIITSAIFLIALFCVVVVVAIIWAHGQFEQVEQSRLAWTATIAAFAALFGSIGMFFVGWWFGHTEVKGWLRGADQMTDRLGEFMTKAVTVRNQHIDARSVNPMAPYGMRPALPPMPAFSMPRTIDNGDDIEDL